MTIIADEGLLPAWKDPVHDAQATFRCLLKALSEPGVIQQLPVQLTPVAPLMLATTAACLSLMDFETPVWLAPGVDTPALRSYLRFHCGMPLVSERVRAQFAVLAAEQGVLPPFTLHDFAQGSLTYPDTSATLLIQLDDLEHGPQFWMSGPGIKDRASLRVSGLPEHFFADWEQNHQAFPAGVDVIFCCEDKVLGLPRTTRLQKGDAPCMSQ
ncbi:phosphonate C-P lyase system protein PhnH [Undibacterium sp. SXout7W]|uniref:phosphonate C-P lyase system protein PhnH n=1 Tax=Undibacterium sp. SXout7W TaxID=3413049 RepID=UPI003BF0896B